MPVSLPASPPVFRPDKLRAAIHYVCFRSHDPRRLSKTKLNKILYYADREAYLRTGQPITGEVYVKHQYGPVSTHLDEALDALQQSRTIAIAEASGYNVYVGAPYVQYQYVALRRPDLSVFSAEEISLIEQYVDLIGERFTARAISEASHDAVWQAAALGEEIPYHTVFLQAPAEVTAADAEWARRAIGR